AYPVALSLPTQEYAVGESITPTNKRVIYEAFKKNAREMAKGANILAPCYSACNTSCNYSSVTPW
ncbi:MAG TPA: hypothetical protein PKA06_05150, partial [Gemmatales bacterium]|nr:hypothetical protein [Gemmatales bacterium]